MRHKTAPADSGYSNGVAFTSEVLDGKGRPKWTSEEMRKGLREDEAWRKHDEFPRQNARNQMGEQVRNQARQALSTKSQPRLYSSRRPTPPHRALRRDSHLLWHRDGTLEQNNAGTSVKKPDKLPKALTVAVEPEKPLAEHSAFELVCSINHTKLSPQTCSELFSAMFKGIVDAIPGEIYQACYKDASYQGWWMRTPLPWDSWEARIGIRFSLEQAGLFSDLPSCYKTDRVRANKTKKSIGARGSRRLKPVITGWEEGFELGGRRETERVFPVLFFDDTPGEAGNFTFQGPEKPFTFSQEALMALPAEWVAAANLRLPGTDVGCQVAGHETATRFKERLRGLRDMQVRRRLGTFL